MASLLVWTPRALKELAELVASDPVVALLIRRQLEELARGGRVDVKKLRGELSGCYRVRVGKYRVLVEMSRGELVVLRVSDRKESYR